MNKEVARTSRQIQVFHQQNFIKLNTVQKMEFDTEDFFSKYEQIQFPADLFTFNKGILNGKRHFLCSEMSTGKLKKVSNSFPKIY